MSLAARTFGGAISLTKANIAQALHYRLVLVIYALRQIVNPLLYMAVWWAVAGDGEVGGFQRGDVVMYYIVFMVVSHATWAVGYHQWWPLIRLGRLSPHLMRPINPIWVSASGDLASKLTAAAMVSPIWLAMYFIIRPEFPFDWGNAVLFVPALLLAAALAFIVGTCMGLASFWVANTWPFYSIWHNIAFSIGGQVAPIALLPGAIKTIAIGLPFRYTIGFPIEVFIGHLQPDELILGFALQAGWIAVGLTAMTLLWRSGIKRYQAVGA